MDILIDNASEIFIDKEVEVAAMTPVNSDADLQCVQNYRAKKNPVLDISDVLGLTQYGP